MSGNSHYWVRKEELKVKAVEHTKEMQERFAEEIYFSSAKSIVYGKEAKEPVRGDNLGSPKQLVLKRDTVDALFYLYPSSKGSKTAILNFASYKNPGGKFIEGSSAQEESLCHRSTLFNVLQSQEDFYKWNNRNLNKGLYTDRVLYSPNIRFTHPCLDTKCDVITCAAPNWDAYMNFLFRVGGAIRDIAMAKYTNEACLVSRMKLIRDVAEEQKVDNLILGAWGCGVFKQNPEIVIEKFNEVFSQTSIKRIIYAVPDKKFNLFHDEIEERL